MTAVQVTALEMQMVNAERLLEYAEHAPFRFVGHDYEISLADILSARLGDSHHGWTSAHGNVGYAT